MKSSVHLVVLAAAVFWIASAPCWAQNLYVASPFSSTVGEYSATTGVKINGSFITGLFKPQNLALSGNNLYVTNLINSNYWTVGEYNATTGAAIKALLTAGLNPPEGLAVAGSDLYVSSSNRVGKYNAITGTTINATLIGLRFPQGLAVSGNYLYVLYVTGTGTEGGLRLPSYVSEYNATTGALINPTLVTGVAEPKGLAVSGGILYVGSAFSDTVGEYSAATGAKINATLITSVNPPQALAVSGGDLYVLYLSGTYSGSYVGRYNATTGAPINGTLITGLVQPTAIAVSPPPPSLSSAPKATGTTGVAFHYQITADNAPSSFSASGLPTGLNVDAATGLISGKTTVSGTFAASIAASNAGGTDTKPLTVAILPHRPAITSRLKASSTMDLAFQYQITASNDPVGFSATGLPDGLSVDPSTGLISGTPDICGIFPATIGAINDGGTGAATLTVTVNFNGVKGSYVGLATSGGEPLGLFTLSLTPGGGFTAGLSLAGGHYSLKGSFSPSGTFSGTLSAGGATLDVALTLDPSLPGISGAITAVTSGGTNSYTVDSSLLGKGASSALPQGLAGRYTAIIPAASGTDPTLPHAAGFATMTVTTKGAVHIAGKLGDGTAFTVGGRLQAGGTTCALFTPLYGKTDPGSIAGTLNFEATAGSDSDAALEWIKPPQGGDAYYPGGFVLVVDLMAAKYAPPPLSPGAGTFTLGGGDLPDSAIVDDLTISSTNSVVVSGDNEGGVTVTLTPASGAFSGTFLYPGTGGKTSFSGVIYEKPAPFGFGLFPGADQIGGLQITQ